MAATRRLSISVFCLSLIVPANAAAQRCKSVRVPNVKNIFAVAPSPTGGSVLFYGSAEAAEGETVTGNLFRLRLDPTSSVVRVKSPGASNPPVPVWQPDGSSAYFETDDGIYQLSSAGDTPEVLWKGPAEGLAISPDSFLLAFWRIEKGTDTLVVFDLRKKSEARTWRIPDRFESDKSGWDIAFDHDGRALYARTYDEPSNTPLKRFDLGSGNVAVVNPNAYAAAGGKEAVYFIGVSGDARSLHKIAAGARSTLLAKEFDYDSLGSSGNPRWLVSQDYRTKQMAVLDTETDAIKQVGKHEAAAVLSDGKLLSVKDAEITIGDSSCKGGWPRGLAHP
jgi:hypothetical protein